MGNQHSETKDSKSLCILVADDLEVNQKIAQSILQKAGHRVDLAENGQQAVAACKRHRYDLIFMDIQMPIMDGYEATRKIRELQLIDHSSKLKAEKELKGDSSKLKESNSEKLSAISYQLSARAKRTPIIAMTGNACAGGFNQSEYPGMNDCIGKPIQRDRLLEMVLKWTRPANDKPAVDRPVADFLPDSKKSGKGQLPFDFNRAVQEFMGQKKLLVSVLKGFIENAGIRLEVIQRAVKSNDYDLIAREAHSIKGGAANLTADVLAGTAADLEQAAVERRLGLTCQLTAELELDVHDLLTFIRGNVTGMD